MKLVRGMLCGAAAGAAGTTALNAVTYLDMVLRGRPTSDTPEKTVEKVAEVAHLKIPGSGEERKNRVAGLGPMTGLAAGIGVGAIFGCARSAGLHPGPATSALLAAAAAMAGADGPMSALGITDPKSWSVVDWMSDIIPHLAYGAVTAALLRELLPARTA
ncbi:hypothetical protein [Paenarthrobacter sp. PH39-S1]|uniref:hypothetical protein n=1 Tax=Paenarthrobacter sp. PH39-S1 TaxID=3046204 RepID=UPI0024B9B4F5|nr:hypothetical protein [Paenarthrobacter sp. PH39-S1]MDJ0358305.1 hypothetical protein [Paenarthrobacter sp. PH39-S1]